MVKKYSVIIPTFNRAHFLPRAIESVLSQTYQASEIIVVDDGSSDNSAEIVASYSQVSYIYKENGGVSSARNVGIKKAKYEYIAFLDVDDEWCCEKMEKQLASNSLVSYTDEIWIRDHQEIKIPKKFFKTKIATFHSEIDFCNIAPSSVVIHKSVFTDIELFDENLEVCEDYDLWLRILLKYKIDLIDEKLIKKYAGHSDQLSMKHWGMDRFRVQSLEKIALKQSDTIIYLTLVKKYELLLKGAVKYDRLVEVKFYKNRIEYFNNLILKR